MEENEEIKEEREIKGEKKGKYILMENEEEDEDNNLLIEKEKNEEIDNKQFNKEKENQESLLNINNDDIKEENIKNNNIDNANLDNKNNQVNNGIIGDYLITIQYTKYLNIPYFIFGNIINFYCPGKKFKNERINLSQIPTPPFGIVNTQSKK